MITGYRITQVVHAACTKCLFDHGICAHEIGQGVPLSNINRDPKRCYIDVGIAPYVYRARIPEEHSLAAEGGE